MFEMENLEFKKELCHEGQGGDGEESCGEGSPFLRITEAEEKENTQRTQRREERNKGQLRSELYVFFFVTLMREFANQPLLRLIKKCIQPKIRLPFLSIIYNIKLSNFYIFSLLKNCKEVQLREPF